MHPRPLAQHPRPPPGTHMLPTCTPCPWPIMPARHECSAEMKPRAISVLCCSSSTASSSASDSSDTRVAPSPKRSSNGADPRAAASAASVAACRKRGGVSAPASGGPIPPKPGPAAAVDGRRSCGEPGALASRSPRPRSREEACEEAASGAPSATGPSARRLMAPAAARLHASGAASHVLLAAERAWRAARARF